ncbi:MAG: permease [PVC group bacterium]
MIAEFFITAWAVLLELSPPLLLGTLIAGLLHVFLPPGLVSRHLSRSTVGSVLRAVLLGIPMPLCSCGVIPTTIGLKNEGASPGAATGFLISTPQTGVDSILVSATFLGWPFALFKVLAAFVTGMIGGTLVNLTGKQAGEEKTAAAAQPRGDGVSKTPAEVLRYGIFELLGSIDIWIVLGVVVSAIIAITIPGGYLSGSAWTGGIGGMLIVLAIALPLYVCTTGSVPIAASLIAAGMPTGAALVFLMAGPATNIATLGAVYRVLGKRVLAIYLGTVAVMSIALGLTFDWVIGSRGQAAHHHAAGGSLLQTVCAAALSVILVLLLGRRILRKRPATTGRPETGAAEQTIRVRGMTCHHCVKTVKDALEAVAGVTEAAPDLRTGTVRVRGAGLNRKDLARAIRKAGYETD